MLGGATKLLSKSSFDSIHLIVNSIANYKSTSLSSLNANSIFLIDTLSPFPVAATLLLNWYEAYNTRAVRIAGNTRLRAPYNIGM